MTTIRGFSYFWPDFPYLFRVENNSLEGKNSLKFSQNFDPPPLFPEFHLVHAVFAPFKAFNQRVQVQVAEDKFDRRPGQGDQIQGFGVVEATQIGRNLMA